MTLPLLSIADDAASPSELATWQSIIVSAGLAGIESQNVALYHDDIAGDPFYERIKAEVGLELIHCLLFRIHDDHYTELHSDIGEYSVIFFPWSCPLGPLRAIVDGVEQLITVAENRLVYFDCQAIPHQQVVPPPGDIRVSVVFKFRR